MKNLLKWQIVSLISRLIAMGVGLFQTFFIIRLLSPSDWGIIQIGMAIGGAFGIYQHLGLSSGSTREISTAENDTEIFKIFVTSVLIRYLVSVPVALFLFFSAENLAVGQYSQQVLVLPIKIYAIVLLIQGIKGLMNSVVSGTKRFNYLFLYQSGITIVSVIIYIPLVYYLGILGFFYAFLAFEVISTVVLGFIAFKPLQGRLEFPSKDDILRISKELFSILFAIYFVKILLTQWEKSGTLLLGLDVSTEQVAIFSFAFLFAKKLMHISDAVTDVNLPILSDSFAHNLDEFKTLFSQNLNKIFVFMLLSAIGAIFWSRELVYIFVGNNLIYNESITLMIPLIFTFIFYGLTNIIKSSVFIPAKYVWEIMTAYVLMLGVTISGYLYVTRFMDYDNLLAMTYSLLAGSLVGLLVLVISSQVRLKFVYLGVPHILMLLQAYVIMQGGKLDNIFLKAFAFAVLVGTYILSAYVAKFLTVEDLHALLTKLKLRK